MKISQQMGLIKAFLSDSILLDHCKNINVFVSKLMMGNTEDIINVGLIKLI